MSALVHSYSHIKYTGSWPIFFKEKLCIDQVTLMVLVLIIVMIIIIIIIIKIIIIIMIIIIIIMIIIIGTYIAPFPFIKCSKALHIVIV